MTSRTAKREIVLSGAAFAFMLGYTGIALGVAPPLSTVCWIVLVVVWATFATDIVVRAVRTGPAQFLRRRWWEVVILALPLLQALRTIRGVRHLPYFRRATPQSVRVRLILEMVLALIVYVYITSLHVYAVENSAPGATIDSWGNSVWWTIVTMATVGFGDFTPITIPGRIVAVGNMVVGVIVIGITSATVVNYLSQLTTKAAHDQPKD